MSDIILANQDIVKVDRKIQTDIFNYSSSEFFINMKESDIPPKGHPDRADFIKREREKCRIGLTVGGVYIPGNLYFHFNHFYLIGDDGEDESGRTQNAAKIATLRDNDWIIHTEYAKAVKEKKGYCLASSRQLGKTSCLTSLTLREVSLYENAEALLIFGSLQDKQSFTKKIKVGIEHGQPFIIRTPIDKDWSNKTEIRFGYTNKDNTTVEKARIFLYNVDGGTDSEKGAGKALVHGSKVYYKDRVGNIEDCKIGDKIYGADGKLTTITGVYPQGVVDLFKITFIDGRTVICCKEHLWTVSTNQYNFQTVDTNHLLTLIKVNDIYLPKVKYTKQLRSFAKKLNIHVFKKHPKIKNIEKVESNYATCISVDNKDKMFLTNDFIPTHNTVTFFAMDEVGKYPFQASWEAVEPALKGKNGYRSAPYFSWTGGDTEKAKEAFKFTLSPESSNLLEFETEGKKTSKVMFATYRQDCKIKIPFTTFLDNENIKYDKKNQDLKSLTIEVSNVEEATKKTLKELENKKKDKDPLAYIKHRAYYPLCLKDILAKETKNNFNKEFIDQQLEYLKDVGYDKVEVFRDIKTGEVKHKFSFAPVIEDWRKPNFLDTPVKIWDFPKHTEFGVHVIGIDPVREDQTISSDSLVYFTVLRRLHSDLEDPFRGKQVASWLGRKRTVDEGLQLLLDVAEWYNAQILYEHTDRSLLSFFERKRKLHLLIDTVPLQKEISIKAKTKNNKGLRPTPGNKQFLLNSTLGWVNEELEDESLGYSRIMDEVLLNQLAEYDPDENLDCYIGFSHAVAAYNYFEKFGIPQVEDSNKKQITSNKKPVIYNAFGIPYNKNKKNAFGF